MSATGGLAVGGRTVPTTGEPLRIYEEARLDFTVPDGAELHLAGLPVPMLGGAAEPSWVTESRREQWVGELDLTLTLAGGEALRPRLVVLPRRTTLEGFNFLVEQFRAWSGPLALSDAAGRARIWAELAPRTPRREEERALVAVALVRRALPAFVALHRAPATAPVARREWTSVDRTAGRRVLLGRLHRFDPPRPAESPREGRVATVVVEPGADRAENRFVVGVVRRLLALAHDAGDGAFGPGADPGLPVELAEASATLARLVAEPPWGALPEGAAPPVSFLLRDHPHYRVFRTVSAALDDALRFSPLPGDPVALGLRTQTLNALFEVWVSQALRAAVRRRLGLPASPGAPLPRGGVEEAVTTRGRVRVAFDRSYPRRHDPGADGSIVATTRKRSPDAAAEWWPVGGRPVVLALDATWSRNPTYHDDKLGYARSLAQGDADPMTGAPRLVVRRGAVVYPGPVPGVAEAGFDLTLATVSAPPSADGWRVLGAYLDRALDAVVPAGLSADPFTELGSARRARPGLG